MRLRNNGSILLELQNDGMIWRCDLERAWSSTCQPTAIYFLRLGTIATFAMMMTMLIYRFTKLKNEEFSWWMETIETILPKAKERLAIFHDATRSLKEHGEIIKEVELTTLERDPRWNERGWHILMHTEQDIDDAKSIPVKRCDTMFPHAKRGKVSKGLGMKGMRIITGDATAT
jgi:hypothetical protein